jgi:hypothetical protein
MMKIRRGPRGSTKKRKTGPTDGRPVDSVDARVVWRRANLDNHYVNHPAGVNNKQGLLGVSSRVEARKTGPAWDRREVDPAWRLG